MTTYTKPPRIRASDLKPEWHVIDAEGKTLGRIASEVAVLLQGKHKATFVPNLNTGDYVIVLNAAQVRVTGKKLEQKRYYRHSGYIGGLREETLGDIMEKSPTRALTQAIKGMLPKSRLGRRMLSRLKVYAGDSHPHEAQLNAGAKAARAAEAREKAAKSKKPTTSKRTTKKATAEAASKAEAQVSDPPVEAPAEEASAEEGAKAPTAETPVEEEAVEEAIAVETEAVAEEEKPKAKPKKRTKATKPKAKAPTRTRKTKAKEETPAEEPSPEESTEEESS